MARPEALQGNKLFSTWCLALCFGLGSGQAEPGYFGVGVSPAWGGARVERSSCQLFVALQFARDDFSDEEFEAAARHVV